MQLATPVTQEELPELLKGLQDKTSILWNDSHSCPIEGLSALDSAKDVAFLLLCPPTFTEDPPLGLDWNGPCSEAYMKEEGYEFVDNETFFERICSTVTVS